jgi:2-polyprenyl-6-methoxyphenol hydroxylase-like FAD-dependent oxidoreductase
VTSGGSETGRAIVIGGSMSGLFAALLLRQAGWHVDVYERVESELAGRGAGIVAQPEMIEVLRSLGLNTGDLGVQVTTRKILDRDGRIVAAREIPQIMTAWERVYRILRDAFPAERYHRGMSLKGFEQDAGAVSAYFTDGSTAQGGLLIGADGLRSTVRQQCLPDVGHLYAGYVAWRSMIAEGAMSPATHGRLPFGDMTFCLPPGEQFLGYPVAGPENDLRAGHRRYNVIWYRPAEEHTELRRLLTDDNGTAHAISIPPRLIPRGAIAEMRADAERLLAPVMREVARLMDEPLLQPIYDLASPRMAFGRVAVIGDAAFVARPHVGAGVSTAAGDAVAIVEGLARHAAVVEALQDFEAKRLTVGQRIIERARHLGAFLQATHATEEERIRSRQHSVPQAVLAETALTDFLAA